MTLVARREDALRELAGELASAQGIRAEVVAADLADPGARDRLVAEIERLGLEVDVLVANAGFGSYGAFVEADRARELEQVRVNGEAVVDLAAASGAEAYADGLPGIMFRSAEQVAAAGLDGLERGRRVVVPGAPNRIGALLGRFSPRPVVLKVMDAS